MAAMRVGNADGTHTSYNLPEPGQVVRLPQGRQVMTVKVTAPAVAGRSGEYVIVTGYRVYASGRMSDRVHSYPVSVRRISWDLPQRAGRSRA